MPPRRVLLVPALALWSLACAPTVDRPPDDAGAPDAGAPCLDGIDLIVSTNELGPQRVYAPATVGGEEVALLVDTGSQFTFLSAPEGTPDGQGGGPIRIGCEERTVIGRPFDVSAEIVLAGLPVVGILGADYFLEELTRLDLATARIERVEPDDIDDNIFAIPYTDVFGFLFVDVVIDGEPLLLGFDTGANHALWIGVDGRPGDQPISSVDGYGNPITLHLGTGVLELGALPPATIPVMRILEHQSIEDSDELLGIDADGLFGLTSLPGTAFVVDAAAAQIFLRLD